MIFPNSPTIGDLVTQGTKTWEWNGSGWILLSNTLTASDIPDLPASKITSGSFGVVRGGTGLTSLTPGSFIRASSSSSFEERTPVQVVTDIGATTVGYNIFTLPNPTAVRFIRINGNNTVSALTASEFRTAIGAGTLTEAPIDGLLYGRKDGSWAPVPINVPQDLQSVLDTGNIALNQTITLRHLDASPGVDFETVVVPGGILFQMTSDGDTVTGGITLEGLFADFSDAGGGLWVAYPHPDIASTPGTYYQLFPSASGTFVLDSTLSTFLPGLLGTMAYQNANAVAITGGAIDGTTIGATTRNTGAFTTITTTNDSLVNGLTVGKGGGNVATNTALGINALVANTTGASNVAIGDLALVANATGNNNTAVGKGAGGNYTSGGATLIGYYAGGNFSGTGPFIAIGSLAAYPNASSRAYSIYIGDGAGGGVSSPQPTLATGCIAIGSSTLSTATGQIQNNIAIGNNALTQLGNAGATSQGNVAIGVSAGQNRTAGGNNVLIGSSAGATGGTGAGNVAVGSSALLAGGGGGSNFAVAIGIEALNVNTSGQFITGVGGQAGRFATGGGSCVYIGFDAGVSVTTANANVTGANNTFVGTQSGPASPTQISGATALGYQAVVGTSNTVVLGRTTDNTVIGATDAIAAKGKLQVTGGPISSDEGYTLTNWDGADTTNRLPSAYTTRSVTFENDISGTWGGGQMTNIITFRPATSLINTAKARQLIFTNALDAAGTGAIYYRYNTHGAVNTWTTPIKLLNEGDNITLLTNNAGYTTNTGTVTSVAMTVPTGLSIAGSPITTSGTLALTYAAGYVGYTTTEQTKLSGIATSATANSGSTSIIDVSGSFQRAALTGDVTATQNNNATTIANGVVTNAKLANMANSTIKGRTTAGAGAPEDLTASQVRTILNVADGATANAGTVTSINLANSTGLTASGGPITTSGSLTYTLSANLQAWHAVATTDKANSGAVGSSLITMSTARILGRTTASTGAVEEITIGTGLSLSSGTLSASGSLSWTTISSNTTLTANASYMVNSGLDVTLPASFSVGDQLIIHAKGGTIKIIHNGNTISFIGSGNNLILDDGESVYLVATGTNALEIV